MFIFLILFLVPHPLQVGVVRFCPVSFLLPPSSALASHVCGLVAVPLLYTPADLWLRFGGRPSALHASRPLAAVWWPPPCSTRQPTSGCGLVAASLTPADLWLRFGGRPPALHASRPLAAVWWPPLCSSKFSPRFARKRNQNFLRASRESKVKKFSAPRAKAK